MYNFMIPTHNMRAFSWLIRMYRWTLIRSTCISNNMNSDISVNHRHMSGDLYNMNVISRDVPNTPYLYWNKHDTSLICICVGFLLHVGLCTLTTYLTYKILYKYFFLSADCSSYSWMFEVSQLLLGWDFLVFLYDFFKWVFQLLILIRKFSYHFQD